MNRPRTTAGSLALGLYLCGLLASVVALWLVDLRELAVALLVVEVALLATVAAVRRRPDAPAVRPTPSTRPWIVPLIMVGGLLAMVLLAVLAAGQG